MLINGKQYALEKMTAQKLLETLALQADRVVLEVSGAIVTKAQYESFVVSENDTVEIVSFVGGG